MAVLNPLGPTIKKIATLTQLDNHFWKRFVTSSCLLGATIHIQAFLSFFWPMFAVTISATQARHLDGLGSGRKRRAPCGHNAVRHSGTVNQGHEAWAPLVHLLLPTSKLHDKTVGLATSILEQSVCPLADGVQKIQAMTSHSDDAPLLQTQAGNCIMDLFQIASERSIHAQKSTATSDN